MTSDLWTRPRRAADGRYRPILHVRIVDGMTGTVLADVDAASTADGLAYYLRSRGIDEHATEGSVAWASADEDGRLPTDRASLIRQTRDSMDRTLVASLVAEVGP